jgi:hypothetical protein
MKIQEKDFFHGAALTQIVEHPSFKALNKADEKYGHYQINHNTRILLKYRSKGESPWTFELKEEDINTLIDDIASDQRSFLCLVCGKISVCILSSGEYQDLINTSQRTSQHITIELPPRSSMKVKSKIFTLDHTIPHTNFPNILFR